MTQLDRGLYAPLVVEDPAEPGGYDREFVVVVDDWTDGVGESPDAVLRRLQREGMGHMMGGIDMSGMVGASALGGDAGDVAYPLHLLNGRPPDDPATFEARPGERVRLRLVNAAPTPRTALRWATTG